MKNARNSKINESANKHFKTQHYEMRGVLPTDGKEGHGGVKTTNRHPEGSGDGERRITLWCGVKMGNRLPLNKCLRGLWAGRLNTTLCNPFKFKYMT